MLEDNNTSDNSGNGEAVKDTENIVEPATESVTDNSGGNELETLKDTIQTMEARMQQQSALIGKLNNAIKREEKTDTATEPATKEKTTGEVQQYNELKQQLEVFQSRMQKQERAAKLGAIELALVEAGATPNLAKSQSDFFAYKLGERLITQDDDAGNISIEVADTDGINVSVSEWAKALLQSDGGSYLRSGKTGPSVNNDGQARAETGKVKLSQLEYSKGIASVAGKGQDAIDNFRATHAMKE